MCRHTDGSEGAASVAAQLEAGPSPGVQYWLTKLQLLCLHACGSAKGTAPRCDQQRAKQDADSKQHSNQRQDAAKEPDSSFEKAVAAHGSTSAALWLLWLRHLRQQRKPTALLIQRAIAALPGELADGFVASAQSGSTEQD